jgi:putative solute:sodium symporter small subunit
MGERPDRSAAAYWRANKRLIAALLAVWALVSYGFAILLARPLNEVRVGALPAGFWWAQQGSMVVFVLLIFVYAWVMDRLDEKYDVHEERRRPRRAASSPKAPGGEVGP